jgi:hypothetical protein
MLRTLTTTAGLVLLVSSFAVAGQTPAKPSEPPKVTTPSQQQTAQPKSATKKHHKHHKKPAAPTATKQ